MRISTKGRYALRLMLDLAQHDQEGSVVSLKEISLRQGITIKYLEQIIAPLVRAGLVRGVRGSGGGYCLTRSPAEYLAGDILRAAEGSLAPLACLAEDATPCTRRDSCATLPFWQGLDRVISQYVDSVTLADLMRSGGV